jgi:hypothetical protein
MARYTIAYSSFIANLTEVDTLIRLATEKERKNAVALRREISSLCRGAVVLLSSHLEAYIKELGEVALDSLHAKNVQRNNLSSRFFFYISKNFIDDLQDTAEPEKIAEHLFAFIDHDLKYWSKVGAFPDPISVEQFNKGFSNPALSKICAYINRFGYAEYKRDLGREMKASFTPVTNMVEQLVKTRNKIAHGDPLATMPPADIRLMVDSIRSFAATTDSLFASWWKSNFCSIR